MKRLLLSLFLAAAAIAVPAPAFADGARFAVIVEGASGDPQYATLHRGWVDSLADVLRKQFNITGPALSVLTETPKDGELRSTAESVKGVFARLAKETKKDDLVFVMLIGHGTADATAAKFNLIGPDLTAEDWNGLLKPIQARIAFVNSTGSSFPFLAGLAGPNRIVITATSTMGQKYDTVFADAFIKAMTASEADADKNGRISLMEAFNHASRLVALHYEQAQKLSIERASIDDTGDGKGRDASTQGDDGNVAAFTYLAVSTIPTVSDPAVQELYVRQQALTEQVDDLRRRKASMSADEFDREFEKLIVDLALVSRDIRRKTGKK